MKVLSRCGHLLCVLTTFRLILCESILEKDADDYEVDDIRPASHIVPGSWSKWTHWGGCNAACGIGLVIRTRTCFVPTSDEVFIQEVIAECPGYTHMARHCVDDTCATQRSDPEETEPEGNFEKLFCSYPNNKYTDVIEWITPSKSIVTELHDYNSRYIVSRDYLYIKHAEDYNKGVYGCNIRVLDQDKIIKGNATLVVRTCRKDGGDDGYGPCGIGTCVDTEIEKSPPFIAYNCICPYGGHAINCEKDFNQIGRIIGIIVAVIVVMVIIIILLQLLWSRKFKKNTDYNKLESSPQTVADQPLAEAGNNQDGGEESGECFDSDEGDNEKSDNESSHSVAAYVTSQHKSTSRSSQQMLLEQRKSLQLNRSSSKQQQQKKVNQYGGEECDESFDRDQGECDKRRNESSASVAKYVTSQHTNTSRPSQQILLEQRKSREQNTNTSRPSQQILLEQRKSREQHTNTSRPSQQILLEQRKSREQFESLPEVIQGKLLEKIRKESLGVRSSNNVLKQDCGEKCDENLGSYEGDEMRQINANKNNSAFAGLLAPEISMDSRGRLANKCLIDKHYLLSESDESDDTATSLKAYGSTAYTYTG